MALHWLFRLLALCSRLWTLYYRHLIFSDVFDTVVNTNDTVSTTLGMRTIRNLVLRRRDCEKAAAAVRGRKLNAVKRCSCMHRSRLRRCFLYTVSAERAFLKRADDVVLFTSGDTSSIWAIARPEEEERRDGGFVQRQGYGLRGPS